MPKPSPGEQSVGFVFEGTLTPEQFGQLGAYIGGLGCSETTRVLVNPERIPRTDEGFRKEMLEELPSGFYVSRSKLSHFTAANSPNEYDESGLRQRAYTGFDAVAKHLKLGHFEPETAELACTCPLIGVERELPATRNRKGTIDTLVDPASLVVAIWGTDEVAPTLGLVPIMPKNGQLCKPGQRGLFSSPSFEVIQNFAAALSAV